MARRPVHLNVEKRQYAHTSKAVSDMPCNLFAEELVKNYPSAKVVLSVRDNAQVWKTSMERTILPTAQMSQDSSLLARVCKLFLPTRPLEMTYLLVIKYARLLDIPWNGIRMYDDHNAWIKRLVRSENLLEFNVKQGWKPLCCFLSHEIPEEPFPNVNDEKAYLDALELHKKKIGGVVLHNMMWTMGSCLAVAAGFLIWVRIM